MARCGWQGRTERSVLCTYPVSGHRRAREDAARRAETPPGLLPLDRAGRLGSDVEDDAVDLAQLADHARGDRLQQVVGQARPVGGHGVVGGDGADHDDVPIGALVALDADGADVGEYAEGLPELAVETGLAD